MGGYLIERATTTEGRRDQIINMVSDRMKYSETFHDGIRQRLPRYYDLWRGVYTGRYHPHKNNVHIPIIFSSIMADAARKVATSFNAWPVLNFAGYGPDDMPIARKREALVSAQMKDADAFMKELTTFVTADLYGVAISQVMWDFIEEERIIEDVARLPLSGTMARSIHKGKVVTFDGPNWENVDRLDFFPSPGVKDINKMPWVIRRLYLDIDEVRALASAGMFDKAELSRLEREGGVGAQGAQDSALMKRFQVRTGMSDEEARWQDKYSRPIELLEYWGTVPSELSDDGVLKRVITVANRRYLLRNKANPFWHGRKPFVAYSPMPDPHYFDAPGKAEICEKLQLAANRYINQTLDAADISIDPMWFYNKNKGINTKNLFSRPGRWIGVEGNPADAVYPMQVNTQGIFIGEKKAEEMRRYAQMGSGMVEDAVQGMPGPDRQTAREFVGRTEAAGTRLLLESRIYEEAYLEPLGNMIVALDKQFLELPKEVLILGDNAQTDPVTGFPIQSTREELAPGDLNANYAARAQGATSALSRGVRQQNLGLLLQYVAGNPQLAGAVNMVNFMREIFREFEIKNVNEIMAQQPAMQPILQQILGQEGQVSGKDVGGVPTSGQLAASPDMGLQLPGYGGGPSGLQGTLTDQPA
jgi:hypothetical protein